MQCVEYITIAVEALVAAGTSVLAVITVFSSFRQEPRTFAKREWCEKDREALLEARREAMRRASHLETLLGMLCSFELGVLAYLGSQVATWSCGNGSAYMPIADVAFVLICFLLLAIGALYNHTWRIYISYMSYCLQIEIHMSPVESRTIGWAFSLAKNQLAPRWIRGLIGANVSIQFVSLFQTLVFIVAATASAALLHISFLHVFLLSVIVVSASVIYITPSYVEFSKLVDLARNEVPGE